MTHKAKGVPCEFRAYWDAIFPKQHNHPFSESANFGQKYRRRALRPLETNGFAGKIIQFDPRNFGVSRMSGSVASGAADVAT